MARKLTTYEFPNRNMRYPWEDWLDGNIWKLEQKKDFECKATSLVAQAHTRAKRMGGIVQTHTENETTVVLQFSKPPKPRTKEK